MARTAQTSTKRPRISIDVDPVARRRLRIAAARRDVSVRKYVLDAIAERVRQDLGDDDEGLLTLSAVADPVLAGVWDNPKDAEYDRL
jgi:uncharacterized protein (DUF1778 family)